MLVTITKFKPLKAHVFKNVAVRIVPPGSAVPERDPEPRSPLYLDYVVEEDKNA